MPAIAVISLASLLFAVVAAVGAYALARWPSVPDGVVRSIEQHLAGQGIVTHVRPAVLNLDFGSSSAGARQYQVSLRTPFGMSQQHTVEVDPAGRVRTVL